METSCEGVDGVERSCEDEVVVYSEFVEAGGEVALVDEGASFVYYEEGEDDPVVGDG